MNLAHMVIGLNTWHILSDLLLLAVPIAMLWDSKMKWTVKLRVTIVGFVGLVNCGLAIARAVVQSRPTGVDTTWQSAKIFEWSMTEITLGVCTASLPVLSVLFFGRRRRRSYKTQSPAGGQVGSSGGKPGQRDELGKDRHRHDSRSNSDTLGSESDPSFGGEEDGPHTVRHHVEEFGLDDGGEKGGHVVGGQS